MRAPESLDGIWVRAALDMAVRRLAVPPHCLQRARVHFPKFWARADSVIDTRRPRQPFSILGWSDVNPEDAKRCAEERAEKVRRQPEGELWKAGEYYPSRPFREPILRHVSTEESNRGIVSRNHYGAEVLNTDSLMFVDVDLGETEPAPEALPTPGWWARLTGSAASRPASAPKANPADESALATLAKWLRTQPGWHARVYRTAAGLRYLIDSSSFDPAGESTRLAFVALGCDPKYAQLCRAQKCFRARLTPKPWRCDHYAEGKNGFWIPQGEEGVADSWVERYRDLGGTYATCRFLVAVGSGPSDSRFAPLIEEHDRTTRADTELPLA